MWKKAHLNQKFPPFGCCVNLITQKVQLLESNTFDSHLIVMFSFAFSANNQNAVVCLVLLCNIFAAKCCVTFIPQKSRVINESHPDLFGRTLMCEFFSLGIVIGPRLIISYEIFKTDDNKC